MNNTSRRLSPNYINSLIDHAEAKWTNFNDGIEELQTQGVSLEAIAEVVGIDRKTIYRIRKSNTNCIFQKNFVVISIITKIREDLSKVPQRKRKKQNKKSLKNANIRVIKGN